MAAAAIDAETATDVCGWWRDADADADEGIAAAEDDPKLAPRKNEW